MSISTQVSIALSALDGVSQVLSRTSVFTITLNLVDYSVSLNITTSPTSLVLPVTPVQFVYIKNIGSTNNLQVTWTPLSGGSVVVQTLTPGSFIMVGQVTTGAGVSAVSVQAISGPTQIEYGVGS